MQTPEIITLSASLCALLIVALLIIGAILGGSLKEKVYRWFFALLMANLLGICCEIVTACLVGKPGSTVSAIILITDCVNYASGSMIFICLAFYLYEYMSMEIAVSKKPAYLIVVLNIINTLLVTALILTQAIGGLDESNYGYSAGMTWVPQMLPVVSMLVLLAFLFRNIKSLMPRMWVSWLFYFCIQIICYIIENIYDNIWVSFLGSAIAIFIIYINIQVELRQKMQAQELELSESRVAIMLTQIQPHFIHNSLLAIQDLCGRDAKEAEKAVKEFSQYLRGNLSSLTNKNNIFFEKEMEHLRLYLSLEQRRFEERLQVEFDIQAKDFRIPALTLQPIVENAVLHGVTKKVEGGKIVIRTRECANHWSIIVEDTGIGFDMVRLKENAQKHVGIQNVRYRLEAMRGGTLDIQSTPGAGTTVIISIPKRGSHI